MHISIYMLILISYVDFCEKNMKRKITKHGPSSLTMSLPIKWVKENNLKAGDEVDVETTTREVIIRKEERTKKRRRIKLNIDKFNKWMVERFIHESYRQGIDEIEITYTREKIPDYRYNREIRPEDFIKERISYYIGLEIISHSKNRIVLENLITKEECEKIEIVRKRIYFLIKEFMNDFYIGMKENFNKFSEKADYYHTNITKFIYYYLRLLRAADIEEETKVRLFGLYMMVIKVKHKLRHVNERLLEMKKITPKIREHLKMIFDLFLEELENYHKENITLEKIEGLASNRYKAVKKINTEKYTVEEARVIGDAKIMTDLIDSFIETHIALNINKYTEEIK